MSITASRPMPTALAPSQREGVMTSPYRKHLIGRRGVPAPETGKPERTEGAAA